MQVCDEVVWRGNFHKFSQNPSLRDKLMATTEHILVEVIHPFQPRMPPPYPAGGRPH